MSLSISRSLRIEASNRTGRHTYTAVQDWPALVADLAAHDEPRLLLLDVDPAVAGWHSDAAGLRDGFARIEPLLLDLLPEDAVIVWTSNTSRVSTELGDPPYHTPAGNRLILDAGKPRLRVLRRDLAHQLRNPATVVVGDQWLTDGLLAWRLRARFVLWKDTSGGRPWWATLQLLAGAALVRPLYRHVRRS